MRVLDSHDGGTIYTISRGDGPPVVFCHGVTLSSRVWAKQFESFPAAGFRAVAFDSRGHGESVAGDTGHSIDNLADDLRSVLEGLDLRDVVLVGHSMGGMAVQAFAIRHPDVAARARVRARAAVDLVAQPGERRPPRARARSNGSSRVGPDVGAFMRQRNLGFLLARIGFGDDPHPSHVEATREMLAACSRGDDPRRCHRAAQPRPHRGTAVDRRADPRAGGHRRRAHAAARLAPHRRAGPRARLVEYSGAGHMLMYERTEEVDALDHGVRRASARRAAPAPARSTRAPPPRPVDVITDVPGVQAGHWTGDGTGVTVVLLPPETVGSVEIRGGAPATRETAVLDPLATVEHVDAVVLTGGSAFGLATADGVDAARSPSRAGASRRWAGRCRSCPRRRSSTSSRPAASGRGPTRAAPRSPPLRIPTPSSRPGGSVPAAAPASAKWRGAEHGTTGGLGSASRA